jgi:uncharacterized protein involved in exopolysaccharide biosynthesis
VNIESLQVYSAKPSHTRTLRDIASVCFRHRLLIVLTFGAIFMGSLLYVLIAPRTYEAETELLVKRERADPVVTPQSNATPILTTDVSEEDLNSEVELLKSRDLLEKVVIACNLDREPPHSAIGRLINKVTKSLPKGASDGLEVPLAVRTLQKKLKVEAIGKTNLVRVRYNSPDPKLSAEVLRTLTSLYLEKHLEVHRPPGTFAFFQEETAQYWNGLQAAERKLADFNKTQNTVSAQTEKSAAQQKLVDFEATLRETRTAIAATEGRLQMLTTQIASTPNRTTTQIRTNSLLLQQLKSTLLTLELKQTEMSGKYAANYIPLRDLESQIAQTRAAIAREDNLPLHDDTTDRNSTYQWLVDELAKAKTDLASLQRQEAATGQQIRAYRSELLVLDGKDLDQQDLIRAAKIQETDYLLYQNKREEARISDALDEKHIVNVSVAEAATTPALPSDPGPFVMSFIGLVLASSVSLGLAFGAEHFNPVLQSPDDVRMLLELPMLASFPKAITRSNGVS